MISFIQSNATPIVGFLTLISNLLFVAVIFAILFHSETKRKAYNFVHKYILELLFWGTMAAVVGSLVYSEIVGFPPCDLCWIQRMMIYPQAIILLVAMKKKDKSIIDYLVPLSVIGAVVSLYQSLIQWGISGVSVLGCTAEGASCAKVYVREYSYITIPFMAFSVFVYVIVLKYVYYSHDKKLKGK